MRRQSFSSSLSSGSGGVGEPLIVVEESTFGEEEAERRRNDSPPRCLDPDSPSLNPYLLSPWREARKHSLPTPQCTTGITASQVRRLSERGGEGSGPTPREAAFLATLSQSTPPQSGGRRHSVVTISRVPATLFGRNRRESIAAFPMGGATRILASRRGSTTGLPSGPPSNSGSTHNLQLDIMDDIAEIKAARKVRLKMWKTPSRERVCEVQPLEGNSSGCAQRYTQYQPRRYSDFALTTIPAVPARRRASEMPPRVPPPVPPRTGIVCTNTDLISILSTLTSSATEIDRCGAEDEDAKAPSTSAPKTIEQKRNRLKSNRSNSFDISILNECNEGSKQSGVPGTWKETGVENPTTMSPSSWFVKRHQPMATKQRSTDAGSQALSLNFKESRGSKPAFKDDTAAKSSPTKGETKLQRKVVWDGSSGTKVDPQVLGNAIEEFLRSSGVGNEAIEASDNASAPKKSPGKPPKGASTGPLSGSASKASAWFANDNAPGTSNVTGTATATATATATSTATTTTTTTATSSSASKDDEESDSCEPSICSTLKDLFVK